MHPRSSTIRRSTVLLVAFTCAALAAVPGIALAHDGVDHGSARSDATALDRRIEALHATVELEALRTTAPRAVAGECRQTIDVPGQGESCRLPGGAWGVLRADGTTAPTHGPDIYATTTPNPDLSLTQTASLTAAGDLVANDDDSAYVACTTDVRVPHTKVVLARPAGADMPDAEPGDPPIAQTPLTGPQTAATVAHLRSAVRQASNFIREQAELDGQVPDANPLLDDGVRLRVLCTADGMIDVQVVDMPELGAYPDFRDIEATVKSRPGLIGADDAGRIAAYYPVDAGGAAGQGWEFDDPQLRRDNYNNDENTFAVHYLVNDANDPHDTTDVDADTHLQTGGVEWDVFLHEMMHNMGAVYSYRGTGRATVAKQADGNQRGHCTTQDDIMCYAEAGAPMDLVARCSELQLDCGHDTYFNASDDVPIGNWLRGRWNSGHVTNRFLDFGRRTNADITAPSRVVGVTASSPSAGVLDVSWAASSDVSTPVQYEACYGTTSPSRCLSLRTSRSAQFGSVAAGAKQVWVQAYDAESNPSVISVPVAVNVQGTVAVDDGGVPGGGTGGTGGTTGGSSGSTGTVLDQTPVAPSAIDVVALKVGSATLEWSAVGAPGSTRYRVEVNREDIGAWSFATQPSKANLLAIALVPGIATKVRIHAETPIGSTRSNFITVTSPVRGSKCAYRAGDTTAPAPARAAKVLARSTRTIKAAFAPPTDGNGVCAIRALARANAKGPWRRVALLPGTARSANFTGLKPRTRYEFALEAVDAAGNLRRTVLKATTK